MNYLKILESYFETEIKKLIEDYHIPREHYETLIQMKKYNLPKTYYNLLFMYNSTKKSMNKKPLSLKDALNLIKYYLDRKASIQISYGIKEEDITRMEDLLYIKLRYEGVSSKDIYLAGEGYNRLIKENEKYYEFSIFDYKYGKFIEDATGANFGIHDMSETDFNKDLNDFRFIIVLNKTYFDEIYLLRIDIYDQSNNKIIKSDGTVQTMTVKLLNEYGISFILGK